MTRRILLTALSALAMGLVPGSPARAAATPSPAPDLAPLLDGCEIQPAPGGAQLGCSGMIATVGDFPHAPLEEIVASQVAGIRASLKGELTTTETTFQAGERSWPGLRLQVRRQGETDVRVEGTLLAFNPSPESPRLVLCVAPVARPELGQRCDALLPLLAEKGPAAIAVPEPKPVFLGKPVAVPAGCRALEATAAGFRIDCGEAAHVTYLRLASKEDQEKMLQLFSEQLSAAIPGLARRAARSCRVGGVPTRCTVLSTEQDGGATFVLGSTVVEGLPILVECGQSPNTKGVHPVCSPVLAL